jgi:3-oxoacyl-[acyl-carrier-protein] synthase-3
VNKIISKLVSVGSYLPKKSLSNDELSLIVETNNEWIVTRTGIKQRYIAEEETTSDMAAYAIKDALSKAELDPDSIDGIIVATTTPDLILPSTAALVQKKLGIVNQGFAFDIAAVCSGFIYALKVADSLIKSGEYKRLAVVGAERMSRVVDWSDRTTCVLFGDGAGAFILEAANCGEGIIDSVIHCEGEFEDILKTQGGTASGDSNAKIEMNGREVFRHAVEKMALVCKQMLVKNGLNIDDISYLITHQANHRIMQSVANKLNFPVDKIGVTVDRHANTSAASIPLAVDEMLKNGSLKEGGLLMLAAAGAGFTWAGSLIRL